MPYPQRLRANPRVRPRMPKRRFIAKAAAGGGGSITPTQIFSSRVVTNGAPNFFGSGDYTTSAFTTVASSLLVAWVGYDNQAGGAGFSAADVPLPVTSGTTWSLVGSAFNTGAPFSAHCQIYKADSPGVGSTNTFSQTSSDADWDGQLNSIDVWIVELIGALAASSQTKTPGTVVSTSGSGRDPGTLSGLALPVAAASNSFIIGGFAGDGENGTSSPGSGWTEYVDRSGNLASGPFLCSAVQGRTGFTGTTINWTDLATVGNVFDYSAIAWEVLAA